MENKISKVSGINKLVRSKAFMLFILLVLLIVLFGVLAPLNDARFFTQRTFVGILQDLSVPAFLTIGAGCLMVSGALDLSQARAGAMSGLVTAAAVGWWGWPWWLAIIGGLVAAAVIGVINAVLVNELNMQPFIATMAMSSVAYAIMFLVATDQRGQVNGTINFANEKIGVIGSYSIGGVIPATVVLMVVAFLIYGIVLAKTKFGRTLYLVGGNPVAAKLSGINSKRISYFLFINCSLLSGVSGIIFTSRVQQGSLLALANDQFTGITAAILGGISFGGGSGGMGGAFLGLLVLKSFNKGMTIIGASSYITNVLSGVLLLAALTLDYFSLRRQQKRIGI